MRVGFVTCVQLGLACIEEIYAAGGALHLVLTLPSDKSQSKSGRVFVEPFAAANGIPLAHVANINDATSVQAIREASLDWLCIIGWSQIAGTEVLAAPRLGCLGIHPTLLPEGRGRASVPWAILKGLRETGVTLFQLDDGVDTGPILAQERLALAQDETAGTLYDRVNAAHRTLIRRIWPSVMRGELTPTPQDNSRATYWPSRNPEDGRLDPGMSVAEAERLVRAVTRPYPGAFYEFPDHRLRVWRAAVATDPSAELVRIKFADGELLVHEASVEPHPAAGKPARAYSAQRGGDGGHRRIDDTVATHLHSTRDSKSPSFRIISDSPFNGSPDAAKLARAVVTPVEHFFVRNHGGMGDEGSGMRNSVRVEGLVRRPGDVPLIPHPSSPIPRASIEATLQCAGNRRSGLHRVRPILNELPWQNEAIGNAVWEGVRLSDILEHAQVEPGAAHVWFTGADDAMGKHAGTKFGASIPLEKAMSGDVIIADTMNGAPLAPEHGAPFRVVVPGYIGARSVKWLTEIRVGPQPSPNVFQDAYSLIADGPQATGHGPEAARDRPQATGHGPPAAGHGPRVLGEFPVSSAFSVPVDGQTLPPTAQTLRGWSIASGANTVERVEISTDGGATWADARFTSPAKQFVWRLWEADVTLARGEHELVCRATDSGGATQPPDAESVWNVKGYANNSWDRVRVSVR